ncbi:P-loop NTPase [Haloarcula sp. S1CR25-12]|uniref:P-loop NTPase n=1 Tax=Haloarcula saliterrae TaxID=2950534 RepID=A0ABU2FDV2_9EURY|nr:P-loop NTPase [Haloarcula sp. S1CR25-12]MDS0260447.1 P-loop NTPase [Haloarcula sp. S1CR25-12]
MRGHCFAVASGKGGVGKTTTVVNTACELTARGYDVVVVDVDLAMTNLGRMVGVDHEPTLHDVLAGRATLEAAINTDGKVAVLPGSDAIDSLRDADPAGLGQVIKRLRTAFEIVIVDTGAGVDHEAMVACGLADDTVLVTTPDETAVTDTGKSRSMVETVDGHVLGVVVTRGDAAAVSAATRTLGVDRLGAVPDAPEVVGDEPVVTTAPKSAVAAAYSDIAETLASAVEASVDAAGEKRAVGDD